MEEDRVPNHSELRVCLLTTACACCTQYKVYMGGSSGKEYIIVRLTLQQVSCPAFATFAPAVKQQDLGCWWG